VIGSRFGFTFLDPLVAIFIAIMVLKTAFILACDDLNTIMGKIPYPKIVEDLKSLALSVEDVKGVHDIKINNMGPYSSAELHIELDNDLTLQESHKIAHQVEKLIINKIEIIKMVTVHTDPVENECEPNKDTK